VPLRIFVVPPWALLTDHYPYGDGLVAFGFIRELAARGHELHVAAFGLDLRDPLPAGVHIHRLGRGEHPGPVRRLELMRRLRRLYRRLRRDEDFHVVHQLNPVEAGVSLALAGSGPPLVLGPYVPNWDPSAGVPEEIVTPAALRLKGVLRAAEQRRAAMVLLSTPAAGSRLVGTPPPGLLVRELPHGIDPDVWRPAGGGPTTGQDVLFLANLNARKGIHVLLDAFARLAPELPAARLLVGGTGMESEAVRRRVEGDAGLARVELLGQVDREDVLATLQACDVYCLPSDGEPFGMTAVEAMACAKPVVATDAGGLRHVVPDEGGRKVPPGDAGALARALREVLLDADRRRAMGEHNRRVVEERFAWSSVVDRLERLYAEAIEG
jgi:glycosyltransferase involved in cell wall biosynthesis